MRTVPLLATLLALLSAPAAFAEADRTGTVSGAAPVFAWDGAMATGYNTARDPAACSHDAPTYCDQTLIKVDVPAGATGELKVTTGDYFGPHCTPADGQSAPCDFSLWLYSSDATGKAGRVLGSSVNDSGEPEEINYRRATAGYYLVIVYYYTVVQSSYKGTATLSNVVAPPTDSPLPSTAPLAPALTALPVEGALSAALAPAGRPTTRKLALRVTCTVVCRGRVTARLSAAQARKLGFGRRALTLAGTSFSVTEPRGAVVTLKPSRRLAAKLNRARVAKLVVRLRATASGGRVTTATRTVTARRG